jgi:hypothetical protein
MESSHRETNTLILDELKKLNKLMGLLVTQGRSPGEKIVLLNQVGLTPKEISETLGVSSNLVSVTIYNERKKKKK